MIRALSLATDMSKPPSNLASLACYSCKTRKRKCSKGLPSCALCTKLLLTCDYDYELRKFQHPCNTLHVPSSIPGLSGASIGAVSDLHTSSNLLAYFSETAANPASSVVNFEADIVGQVLKVITDAGESIPSVTSAYFQSIDAWLPVISQERIEIDFHSIISRPNIDLAILLLCMYLITRTPRNEQTMRNSTYFKAKSLHSLQVSSGKSTIEVVQAGLLISIYEQAHGILEAAPMTMASCSRLMIKMMGNYRKSGDNDIENTELGRLWWGVVIIDRYMNLGVPLENIHLSTGQLSLLTLPIKLPQDDEVVIKTDRPVCTPSGVAAHTQPTPLGPFCRTAEAAMLLGETLEIISGSLCTERIDEEQVTVLDDSLQKLAMTLAHQAVNGWAECCAAIGICLSALLSLHARTWELSRSEDAVKQNRDTLKAVLAIKSVTRMVIDISYRFHLDVAFINIHELPPPATYCVYLAALLHIKVTDQGFMAEEWTSDMEKLKSALKIFGKRWIICRKYLELIDCAILDKSRARGQEPTSC